MREGGFQTRPYGSRGGRRGVFRGVTMCVLQGPGSHPHPNPLPEGEGEEGSRTRSPFGPSTSSGEPGSGQAQSSPQMGKKGITLTPALSRRGRGGIGAPRGRDWVPVVGMGSRCRERGSHTHPVSSTGQALNPLPSRERRGSTLTPTLSLRERGQHVEGEGEEGRKGFLPY